MNSHKLLCYTRIPMDEMVYSSKLAYSMHLAISEDNITYNPLNNNLGILYAKATSNSDETLNSKSLKRPYLITLCDGGYAVLAIRTQPGGEDDEESRGCIIVFTSKDLIQYEEVGLFRVSVDEYVHDVLCHYDGDKQCYLIQWMNAFDEWYQTQIDSFNCLEKTYDSVRISSPSAEEVCTDIEGCVSRNSIEITEAVSTRLINRLTNPKNCSVHVPKEITVVSKEEVMGVKAEAIYTDGSKAIKNVDWNLDDIDFRIPGTYSITGKVKNDYFCFPLAVNRADPNIIRWNGFYYFIATNDTDNNHTLYIRESDSISGLEEAEEMLVLDSDTYSDIKNLLWAPEFHIIDSELYIFFAATTGEFFYEEAHLMKLKQGGNPTNKGDWERPRRIVRKDGSELCKAGEVISLDMTYFEWKGNAYVVWSQRQFIPVDQGAWLYIATLNKEEPWKLSSEPVALAKPEYGWENNHTFVSEGPYAIICDKKLFLTYSASATDATYVVGLMEIEEGLDLLEPINWNRINFPILTSHSVKGEYGTGHNSYIMDDENNLWNVYHARIGVNGPRSTGIRRVHFNSEGYPILDLNEEDNLMKELSNVTMNITVKVL